MNYDGMTDGERKEFSERIIGYLDPRLFAEEIEHLRREIHTLVDYGRRIDTARAILTAGRSDAARHALKALDGTSIDQIMREATTTDEAR